MLLLDVDGVMTDGKIYMDNQGKEIKAFHIHDGYGIRMAQKEGIVIGIISGRFSPAVSHRARELKLKEVHQNIENKLDVYSNLLRKYKLKDAEIAFMGDDLNDLPVLSRVGLSVAVPDACFSIRQMVHWVTRNQGGNGAVREVTDLLLSARSA